MPHVARMVDSPGFHELQREAWIPLQVPWELREFFCCLRDIKSPFELQGCMGSLWSLGIGIQASIRMKGRSQGVSRVVAGSSGSLELQQEP